MYTSCWARILFFSRKKSPHHMFRLIYHFSILFFSSFSSLVSLCRSLWDGLRTQTALRKVLSGSERTTRRKTDKKKIDKLMALTVNINMGDRKIAPTPTNDFFYFSFFLFVALGEGWRWCGCRCNAMVSEFRHLFCLEGLTFHSSFPPFSRTRWMTPARAYLVCER